MIVAKVEKNKRGIYNSAMITTLNFLEIYVLFLQITGILSFIFLCRLAQNENRTRFRFDWLSLSILFFWIHYLCRFLLIFDQNYLIVVYLIPLSLAMSLLMYLFFLLLSCQDHTERNLMGTLIVVFIVVNVILFQYTPHHMFFYYFTLIFPLFCVLSFHLLSNWSLRLQNEKRRLILFWSWSIKLFFIVCLGNNLAKNLRLALTPYQKKLVDFSANLLWLIVIYVMNESFWNLIKWIRGTNKLSNEIVLKTLHFLVLIAGFLVVLFWGKSVPPIAIMIIYSFLTLPLLFFLYQQLLIKNCQKTVKKIEQEYRKFIHYNPSPSGILNHNGEIEVLNPAAEILFETKEIEAIGKRFDVILGRENDPLWMVTLLKTALHKQLVQFSVDSHSLNRAKKRNLKVTIYQLTEELELQNSKFVFSMIDETEAKEIVISKDQMIGLVSHELRTPLTVISESVQLLKKRENNDEVQKQIIDIASRNIEKMTDLINQILNLEKIKSGKFPYQFKKNNIHKLLITLISDFQLVVENKKITFELNLESRKEELVFDEPSITEVISNLIRNAVNHTEQGNIIIGTFATNQDINVFVQDSGTGIKEEDISKIFEPFNPGLGLFVCKTIMEDHHGQIFVESKWGKGSRFTISLPG